MRGLRLGRAFVLDQRLFAGRRLYDMLAVEWLVISTIEGGGSIGVIVHSSRGLGRRAVARVNAVPRRVVMVRCVGA